MVIPRVDQAIKSFSSASENRKSCKADAKHRSYDTVRALGGVATRIRGEVRPIRSLDHVPSNRFDGSRILVVCHHPVA